MKKAGNILRTIIIIILLCVIAFSGYKIYTILTQYHEVDKANEEAVEEYIYVDEDGWPEVDFDKLITVNSDVIGWLYIPDTNVSFPVVQGRDNYVYLTNDYRGRYSFAGAIFMDVNCMKDFSDIETMIYGHNMHNGSMFGRLKKFEDAGYVEAHKDVYVLLPTGETIKYQAAVGKYISVNDDVYYLPKRGGDPETLVLSTCTDDSSDVERFVLICNYEERFQGKETDN